MKYRLFLPPPVERAVRFIAGDISRGVGWASAGQRQQASSRRGEARSAQVGSASPRTGPIFSGQNVLLVATDAEVLGAAELGVKILKCAES